MAITIDNEGKLRSGYEARTPKELPVLNRWFPKEAVILSLALNRSIVQPAFIFVPA
jgi:hypothetical protein